MISKTGGTDVFGFVRLHNDHVTGLGSELLLLLDNRRSKLVYLYGELYLPCQLLWSAIAAKGLK